MSARCRDVDQVEDADGVSYRLDALRRPSGALPSSAGAASLMLGVRLARLMAEAPVGSRLTIRTRASDDALDVTLCVTSSPSVDLTRSGLSTVDHVTTDVAAQIVGLLEGYAGLTPVAEGEDAGWGPDLRPALGVRPRVRSAGKSIGFNDLAERNPQSWATPRSSDPAELARLLLAHPHVSLIQTVEPLTADEVDEARAHFQQVLGSSAADNLDEIIGTPVRVTTVLVAEAEPYTLPLRLREHLRGWFSAMDLHESTASKIQPDEVVPERMAAGLLRFPATIESRFPGLTVEPGVVAYENRVGLTGIRLGMIRTLRNAWTDFRIDETAMSRHMHVIGESGSGKSTALAAIANQTAAAGQGLLLLDPHGTTVDRVLAELPPDARSRAWVVRCGDTKNPVRLNPLAVADADLRETMVSDLLEAFSQLFDPRNQGIVGPRFMHFMRNILASLIDLVGPRASLLDVPRTLYDKDLQEAIVAGVSGDLKGFWGIDVVKNRSSEINEVISWISSKFTTFISNAALRAMLETGGDSFDPADAMASNRIILVDLAKGSTGTIGSRLIGMLYLMRFWGAALTREVPDPFTIIVDEAASFSGVALPAILSEGRKFGLRAVVAHQYMAQLDPVLADAVEGSVGTRIIFRVGSDDARALAAGVYPEFDPLTLSSLPQFSAAVRLADSGLPIRPFTLRVDHNARTPRQSDAAEAEAEIHERSLRELVDPHREDERLSADDVLRVSAQRAPSNEPNGIGASICTKPSYLDSWLEKRKARDQARWEASQASPDDSPAAGPTDPWVFPLASDGADVDVGRDES